METHYKKAEITSERVQEQVGRFQEVLYEFVKGLSKLRREQNSFSQGLSGQSSSRS